MWTTLMVLAIPCVIIVAVVRAISKRPRSAEQKAHEQVTVATPEMADDYPVHREPSPTRDDGSPVPGSRDHRRRHGQP